MQVDYLRSSTIGSFRDCQFRFFLNYIVGIESRAGKKANLGSCVHHILEILAKAKMLGYTEYDQCRYTNIKYLCRICWDRYTKEYPEFEYDNTDKQFIYDQVMAVVNSRFDPLKLKILKVEHQFEIELDIPGFQHESGNMLMRGTIDLITEVDEDTIEVIDYKTGQRTDWITGEIKDYDKFLEDIQLRFYDIATNVLYKDYKYRMLTIIFTRDGGPFTVTFTPEDTNDAIDIVRRYFKEIRENINPTRILSTKGKRNQIWKCNYVCQFGKYTYEFMNDAGEILKRDFVKKKGSPPESIEENGKIYLLLSNEGERICNKYYNILRRKGLEKAETILYQLTLGDDIQEKSRRNDYSREGISRLKANRKDFA